MILGWLLGVLDMENWVNLVSMGLDGCSSVSWMVGVKYGT